jgi:LacI family transcriptional regulator
VIETTRAYGRRIIEGAMRFMRENEPWLIEMEPRSLGDPLPRHLRGWNGDGMIARLVDPASLRALRDAPFPVVYLKAPSSRADLPVPPITSDQEAIGRMAADHLLDRGFRHFGFVGAPGREWSDGRLRGFSARVAERDCSCSAYERTGNRKLSVEGMPVPDPDNLAVWLRPLPRPTGILAADDFMGVRVLNACRIHGFDVPDEIAVVGVDDEEALCRFASPPLSSVIPDNARVGYEAGRLLQGLMEGEEMPEGGPRLIPPLGLVTRESSDTVATGDETVACAMAFIRRKACRGIAVAEVARHAGTSPGTLQRRFAGALGYPVYEAILRARIDIVRGLLTDTRLPLKEIAFRSGFEHIEHLATLFKKRTGKSMDQFRKAASPPPVRHLAVERASCKVSKLSAGDR